MVAVLLISPGVASAIEIDVRRACELTGTCGPGDFFHDHPEALGTLRFAASAFEPFTDALSSVTVPSATFPNPNAPADTSSVSFLSVPNQTLIVYAGGHDLAENRVGEAAPGGPLNTFTRGQGTTTGAGAVDFAPWGGSIAFDTTGPLGDPRNWHFDIHSKPAPGHVDFLSVALHELGHLLGFGTSDAFSNHVAGGHFTGDTAATVHNGNVPLFTDLQHWADGVNSPPGGDPQRVAFGATLTLGRRTLISPLDYAALADIGWQVPEELLGLHGDADADVDVDGGDFLAWQRGNGMDNVGALQGNFNGDSAVDDYDLWLWNQNFGTNVPSLGTFAEAVPEPGTWSAMCLALAAWLSSRPIIRGRFRATRAQLG